MWRRNSGVSPPEREKQLWSWQVEQEAAGVGALLYEVSTHFTFVHSAPSGTFTNINDAKLRLINDYGDPFNNQILDNVFNQMLFIVLHQNFTFFWLFCRCRAVLSLSGGWPTKSTFTVNHSKPAVILNGDSVHNQYNKHNFFSKKKRIWDLSWSPLSYLWLKTMILKVNYLYFLKHYYFTAWNKCFFL